MPQGRLVVACAIAGAAMLTPAFGGPPDAQRSDRPYAVSRPAATGRSGTAAIEARALIGRDAVSLIEVTTGSLDFGSATSGSLSQLQIKAYRSGSAVAFTRNMTLDQASFQQPDPSLYPGQELEVQAHVRALDGSRTDVVTTRPTVLLRPDLAIVHFTGAPEARVGLPVNVSAVVAELNGETGAHADCVLRADDVEVDRAPAIWVDAGGSISCSFMPIFFTAGVRSLRAEVSGVTPGDWDEANNAASLTVDVRTSGLSLQPALAMVVDLEQHDSRYERAITTSYGPPAEGFESERRDTRDGWLQSETFVAHLPVRLTFPITRLGMSITKDGVPRTWTYEDLAPNDVWDYGEYQGACVHQYDVATEAHRAVWFQICSSWSAASMEAHINYAQHAGDVTYFSRGFTRYWTETPANTTSYWSWNEISHQLAGERVPSGSRYTFDAVLVTGPDVYASRIEVEMQPVNELLRFPPEGQPICQMFHSVGGQTEWCREETFRSTGFAGYASIP